MSFVGDKEIDAWGFRSARTQAVPTLNQTSSSFRLFCISGFHT